ncbi:hypothetical protein QFZ94_001806 [Paraburkholderia sp. JPY465]
MRFFGKLASGVFRDFSNVVNRFGEPWREKTRNGGEIFRGSLANFALFLSIQTAEVRIYGSEDGLSCVDYPRDCLAGIARDSKGEGIQGAG